MLEHETILTFSEAAKTLPRLNGKRPSITSVWRWARKGIRGIRLESRALGGRFVTSREALERFSTALAELPPRERATAMPAPRARTRSNRERQRAIVAALDSLTESGVIDAATATDIAGKIER